MLKDVNINESQMDKIIGQLTRRKQKLMNKLHEILSENNKYLNEIYNTIKKYAKELNFDEYIGDSPKFVLTNKLKGKTGRILTHMAFSFKMAYFSSSDKISISTTSPTFGFIFLLRKIPLARHSYSPLPSTYT